jgi:hypothetical protein
LSDNDRWYQFVEIGFQYYALACMGAALGSVPTCANLFHHAFEMLMKGALLKAGAPPSGVEADTWFRKEFGHKLSKLWAEFRKKFDASDSLKPFDTAVAELDLWEEIRYPATGNTVMQVFARSPTGPTLSLTDPKAKAFSLDLEKLAAAFVGAVAAASINVEAFTTKIPRDLTTISIRSDSNTLSRWG